MKKIIIVAAIIAAPIFVIGSACAWSNGDIGILRCLIQIAVGGTIECYALKKLDI